MGRFLTSPKAPWILSAVLLALLALLATLQYRWTGELSRAERDGKAAALQRGLDAIALDLDRQLMVIFLSLALPHDDDRLTDGTSGLGRDASGASEELAPQEDADDLARFAAAWQRWKDLSNSPELIKGFYVTAPQDWRRFEDETSEPTSGTSSLFHLESPEAAWQVIPWPEHLQSVTLPPLDPRRLGRRGRQETRGPRLLHGDVPALVVPLLKDGGPLRRGRMAPRALTVELHREALEMYLRDRIAQHLSWDGNREESLEFSLRLVDRREQTLWTLGPPPRRRGSKVDGEASLFGLRSLEDLDPRSDAVLSQLLGNLRGRAEETRRATPGAEPVPWDRRSSWQLRGLFSLLRESQGGQWRLQATHAAGSLDAAVAMARQRNLWISSGVCGLLAISLGLLLLSTRRAQQVARQQLEFVAGVTHELMTPLAALRSAGENLADGVVREPEQVARYGQLVDREGRRLSSMVAQILELSGMQSGHQSLQLTPTDLRHVVDGALQDCRADLEAQGIAVETDLPDLPRLQADGDALRRCLVNLLQNALKYAAEGGWIGIEGRPSGRFVELTVRDRGPGIETSDRPHLFEPFRRGRGMAASSIPGSGLGLSLVQSIVQGHGGEVRADNWQDGEAHGAVFTLRLPTSNQPQEPEKGTP